MNVRTSRDVDGEAFKARYVGVPGCFGRGVDFDSVRWPVREELYR